MVGLAWLSRKGLRSTAYLTAMAAAYGCALCQLAHSQGLTYLDADELAGNLTPLTAIDSNGTSTTAGTDNVWGFRPLGAASTIYESAVGAEDSPELTQNISGLTPNASYDVYVAYWTDGDENWTIRAGLAPGVNTLYSFKGNFGAQPVPGSTLGITA